eukprot:GFYU01006061.1.p1 GENE.GFYU01006061.1~~GFYU01006061.1.p1  ORF type:complete len:297 (+),score=78.75 GFYU01006061.1:104-892(+)
MSSHLSEVFSKCKAEGRAAFVAYVTCGYPTKGKTVDQILALEAGGADVIEIGVPFSDPIADGPTIQAANHVAVLNGITYQDCLAVVKEARGKGLKAPIVLMGYLNPLLANGEEKSIVDAKEAGANGFIVVDLPAEEASTFVSSCKKHEMSFVPLVAPTTTDDRLKRVCDGASSFVYLVSVNGITGARSELPPDLAAFVARVRKFTELPLAVGFGISTRDHFVDVQKIADGVVIGSAIIKTIEKNGDNVEPITAYAKEVTGRA